MLEPPNFKSKLRFLPERIALAPADASFLEIILSDEVVACTTVSDLPPGGLRLVGGITLDLPPAISTGTSTSYVGTQHGVGSFRFRP